MSVQSKNYYYYRVLMSPGKSLKSSGFFSEMFRLCKKNHIVRENPGNGFLAVL